MRRSALRAAAAGVTLLMLVVAADRTAAATATAVYQVSAWDYTGAYSTSLPTATSAGAIDEVQGDWWTSSADGSLSSWSPPDFVSTVHAYGLRVLATVTNYSTHFDPAISHSILSRPKKTERQVNAIVDACVSQGYDGVDLDWENMFARDRDLFSAFVQRLATALHAQGKILGIAVAAKTSEPGDWAAQKAQDWAALGAAVDEFQVMTYDYHGGWSDPGPVAPPSWMDAVISFAETEVPAGKIWMGVPFYGYDWSGGGARSVTWSKADALLTAHSATIVRTASGEARFRYRARGVRHIVYFQDSTAIADKLQVVLVDHPAIAGIAIWSMGGEDPGSWTVIHSELK
jgi:spore germination protein YaaH